MKKYLIAASWFALNCYAAEYSHSATLSYSAVGGPSASYVGSTVANSIAVDPDSPGLPIFYFGGREGFSYLQAPYTVSVLGDTESFSFADVERFPDFIGIDLYGNAYHGNVELGWALASFDLAQPGGPGNPFEVSFATQFDPGRNAAATPEISTMLMLTLGLGLLALPKLVKARAK